MTKTATMFDAPWKIAALIGLLVLLRIVWGLWAKAPHRRFTVELLDSALIAFLLVFVLVRPFVVQAFYIPSPSMTPTLREGDRLLVNRFIYRLSSPQRGDVIVFRAPRAALNEDEEDKDYVKRLIGLPGDTIQILRNEGVLINNRWLLEPPGVALPDYDWPVDEFGRPGPPHVVRPGCYFVLGDNRTDSNDSHQWAVKVRQEGIETRLPKPDLPASRVLGKAMVTFWPLRRVGLVSDHDAVSLPAPLRVATSPVRKEANAR